MRSPLTRSLLALTFAIATALAQQTIPLYPDTPPGSEPANYPEREYYSNVWKTEVVSNVTKPSLTVYKPARQGQW